jgi:DNA polymerase I
MIYQIDDQKGVKDAYEYLKSESMVGADTETTGLDPLVDKVLLIQLGTPLNQYVFDIARIDKEDLKLVFKILESDKILKVFQNGKFDYKMLKTNFNIKVRNLADTMITEQILTKGAKQRGFGLADLSEKYGAGQLDKSIRSEFVAMKYGDIFTKQAIIYAAEDVRVTPIIYSKQLAIADSKDMRKLILLENDAVAVYAEMELNGIYVDSDKWLALEKDAEKNMKEAEKKLQVHFESYFQKNLFGEIDLNYSSPAQIKPALEKIIKISLESTNEKYLEQFQHDHEVIRDLFDYREASKRVSTYGKAFLKFIHPVTKRIHADYLQVQADSGRSSCRNPNIQNIPHQQEYRTPFCAQHKDYRIISADFASQNNGSLEEESSSENAANSGKPKSSDAHGNPELANDAKNIIGRV